LWVHLSPQADLELTGEAAWANAAVDEQGRREMVNRLPADRIEMAGAEEAGVAAGSERKPACRSLNTPRSTAWC
jgi:hypothetical protein